MMNPLKALRKLLCRKQPAQPPVQHNNFYLIYAMDMPDNSPFYSTEELLAEEECLNGYE